MSIPETPSAVNPGYRLGYDLLGPALTLFARLLLIAARNDGIARLAFVARDGEMLLRVTELVSQHLPWPPPRLEYIYLSRISTSLPAEQEFGPASIQAASTIRAGTLTAGSLFAYFGLDAEALTADLARHGLTPATVVESPEILYPMLRDPCILALIDIERRAQISILQRYLVQQQVLDNPACALVDVGWRGSIPAALTRAFPDAWKTCPLRAYYLGYWRETDDGPTQHTRITGLLSDCQRARNVVEAAPHYLAFLLESVCRADHGTVVGYRETPQGEVAAQTAALSLQRVAEQDTDSWRMPIRRGILDYVATHAAHDPSISGDEKQLLRREQWQLLRLAFFPTREEIAAVSGLVHSEGHAANWSRPLLDAKLPQPILAPRRWLKGLASPWRSAYVAASGGPFFAAAFLLVEAALVSAPGGWRRSAQQMARRIAGMR